VLPHCLRGPIPGWNEASIALARGFHNIDPEIDHFDVNFSVADASVNERPYGTADRCAPERNQGDDDWLCDFHPIYLLVTRMKGLPRLELEVCG
jgi:hypothetical protein